MKKILVAALVAIPSGAVLVLARTSAEASRPATRAAVSRAPARVTASLPASAAAGQATPAATARSEAAPVAPLAAAAPGSHTGGDLLDELRKADAGEARAIFERLLADPGPLGDPAFLGGLLAIATDSKMSVDRREVALDLIGRAPATDEALLSKVKAIAVSSEMDGDTRTWAMIALRQLALDRADLAAPVRGALLEAIEGAPSAAARADALDAVHTIDASDAEIARVSAWLGDADALVRAGAARSLGDAPARVRASVEGELERMLLAEGDADTAAATIASALRVGRGDALALMDRLERAPIVRSNDALARQIGDYRSSLVLGETNPLDVLRAHETREDERLRASGN
jgi:hypothetical protein